MSHWRARAPKGCDPSGRDRSRRSGRPVLASRIFRGHRRPRPCSGRSPKCRRCARRAQWPTSAAMVAAYHPIFPKPRVPQSVGVRAGCPRPVWVGLLSGWDISNLYQPSRKAISAFLGASPDLLLEDSMPAGYVPSRAARLTLCKTRTRSRPLWRRRTRSGEASRVPFADFDRRLFRAPHGVLCAAARGALRPDRGHGGHVRSSPRPKGLVVATQGHGEHPAAASRSRSLGKKYRTTEVTPFAVLTDRQTEKRAT